MGRMTTHLLTTDGHNAYPAGATLMTAAGLESLRSELGRLRERTGLEIAERLREARAYGEGANNDEYHAVREEQMVLQARMASLEETIARAIVVDSGDAVQGVAAIGSTLWVEDLASGATAPYHLAGAHRSIGRDVISAASPMGRALMGAVPGTVATIELPNGRSRTVRLVDVETGAREWDDQEAAA
jgi:transcription elongation factor GreA